MGNLQIVKTTNILGFRALIIMTFAAVVLVYVQFSGVK